MKLLGIDYGRVRVGLAVAEGSLASPLMTIEWAGDKDRLAREIRKVVEKEGVERIVVGISEGLMAKESEELAETLEVELGIPVSKVDETLTTVEAGEKLVEGAVGREKKARVIDEAAATTILQHWLDQGGMVQ